MPHVGVQRFTTREGQEHRAQYGQRLRPVREQKTDGAARVECLQHLRLLDDLPQARHRQHREPKQHDRPEHLAHDVRALALHREQRHEDHHRDRDHEALERRRLNLQPLDRRQHRDGRRDHAVAVEHRRADQPEQTEPAPPPRRGVAPLHRAPRERLQCQDAALAVVVCPQHEDHVFQRHHEHQPPEDQREQSEHRVGRERHAVLRVQRFLEGVERRRADVAEHHAERGDHQARPGCLRGRGHTEDAQ